jgi:hypothetical protein
MGSLGLGLRRVKPRARFLRRIWCGMRLRLRLLSRLWGSLRRVVIRMMIRSVESMFGRGCRRLVLSFS